MDAPTFLVTNAQPDVEPLARLRQRLAEVDFAVTGRLPWPGGAPDVLLDPTVLRAWRAGSRALFHRSTLGPVLRRRLAARHPEAVGLHELLTLGHAVTDARAKALLGPLVDDLLAVGVLARWGGQVRSEVMVTPFEHLLFLSDPVRLQHSPDYVYAGRSSFVPLEHLRATGWQAPGRAMDLGCGAGFAAVAAAAAGAGESVGSDVVERCLRFARLNAELNGVADRTRFVVSDVYSAVDGDFDLVVANTPCVWDELQQAVFATGGGAFGTELPVRMVAESLDRLRPGGTVLVVMTAPVVRGRPLVLDVLEEICAGHPVAADVYPQISEYDFEHAATYRRHDISEFVRYLVVITQGEQRGVRLRAPEDPWFAAYRRRAQAARFLASAATRVGSRQ
jgi:SAM-dependent methyltransferase